MRSAIRVQVIADHGVPLLVAARRVPVGGQGLDWANFSKQGVSQVCSCDTQLCRS